MASQTFKVAEISYSQTGLKADEQIIDACKYLASQEITIVEEDTENEFTTHGCAGIDEQVETGSKITIVFSIKRDYADLKLLFPKKYGDGTTGFVQKNNAGQASQKTEIKIRPLGAVDDTDAMMTTVFVTSKQNTTATAAGTDYIEVTAKATMIKIDGTKRTDLMDIGIDFPAS